MDSFAFAFLTTFADRLQREFPDHPDAKNLLARIHRVCQGHLRWVFHVRKKDRNGHYYAAYFPNGEPVDLSANRRPVSLYSNSLTDGAFQILKVKAYGSITCQLGIQKKVMDQELHRYLNDFGPIWIDFLKEVLPEGDEVCWPRYQLDGVTQYRLDDQFWVLKAWNALDRQLSPLTPKYRVKDRSAEDYENSLLDGFVVRNPYSGRKMFATTRSSRETRFLLHSRDTALLYLLDDKPDSLDISNEVRVALIQTLEIQKYLKDNQKLSLWTKPLRLALLLVLSKHGIQLSDTPTQKAETRGIMRLKEMMAFDGIFPAELLGTHGKSPEECSHRGANYHACFEVAYILLNECNFALGALNDTVYRPSELEPSSSGHTPSSTINSISLFTDKITSELRYGAKPCHSISIDGRGIAEYPDEWLYRRADFLHRLPTERKQGSVLEYSEYSTINDDDLDPSIIASDDPDLPVPPPHTICLDVGRDRLRREGQPRLAKDGLFTVLDTPELSNQFLQQPRTSNLAKKRMVYMPKMTHWLHHSFLLTTPISERAKLRRFFLRMKSFDSSFEEVTNVPKNEWNTELLISFYKIVRPMDIKAVGCERSTENTFVVANQTIQRSVIGYRCSGDIFDRYWTCYLVANGMNPMTPFIYTGNEDAPLFFYGDPAPGTRIWQQRKVLELMIFEYTIEVVLREAKAVLDWIYQSLEKCSWASTVVSDDVSDAKDYFQSGSERLMYQSMARKMLESLESALRTMECWSKREETRGRERPRWTVHKERKYRSVINQLQTSNLRLIDRIQHERGTMADKKACLDDAINRVRDDLTLRNAEDVRAFTYVTSFFFPLAFATGIFSVNGIPDGRVVMWMAITAVAAICVTMAFVFNSRKILWTARTAFNVRRLWRAGLRVNERRRPV